MTRRKKSRWKVQASIEQIAVLAPVFYDRHEARIADGWRLTGSSGIWRRTNGTFTVRLAYRKRNAGWPASMTVTVRQVPHHVLLGAAK